MSESKGAMMIAEERKRQVEVEGWSAAHDDQYICGQLSDFAVCYATREYWRYAYRNPVHEMMLPTEFRGMWKPTPDDRIRELVKAGALIAAEIDRQLRFEERKQQKNK